jgi:NAD(P)-dependent dehydrogenase (short-subunit alcohol dehydrogenase family)
LNSTEKVAIVTGSNSGIGKETALELAKQNYTVIMACRNIESAKKVSENIKSESGNEKVFVYELDLCSFASIRQFISSFRQHHSHLMLLINNAGITTQKFEKTADGYERTIQTNLIGPYILIKSLLPFFVAGNDNRIVNVSSDFYKFGKFDIQKLNDYRWIKAYAVSKYALLLLTFELADQLIHKGITINALHPGVVKTKIMMTRKWYDVLINLLLSGIYVDEKEGAKTSVYVATSPELHHTTAKYFIKNKVAAVAASYDNVFKQKEIIDFCDRAWQKYSADQPLT